MNIIYWPNKRLQESKGFVSQRLLCILSARQCLLFGNSFTQDFGKFKKLLNPWEVTINYTPDGDKTITKTP